MTDKRKNPLTVCYFGTYRAEYSRNQIMIAGLKLAGAKVIECHQPLWNSIEDRVEIASGGWFSPVFLKRVISTYWCLLKQYSGLKQNYDVMVLGYPGQLDVFFARLLTWWHKKPLVMDMFMSIYLIAVERNLHQKSALSVTLLKWLEGVACRLPDLLICDTIAYRDWHCKTFGLAPQKFRLVPTGADDRVFKPAVAERQNNGIFKVLYYGTFIPNHGVKTIIEAANLLKETPDIQFELIGNGPDKAEAESLANQYQLKNVQFINWVDKENLPQKIAEADVILGVFGVTPQSLMTVQNKIYEAMACGKPIITGFSPTIVSMLKNGLYVSVKLCDRQNPQSLVDSIQELYESTEKREKLAQGGYELFLGEFSLRKNGKRLSLYLYELEK